MERNYIKDCANFAQVLQVGESPSHLLLDIDWQKGNLDGGSLVRFPEHLGSWETWPLGTGRGKCARNPTFSECYDQVMISIDISKFFLTYFTLTRLVSDILDQFAKCKCFASTSQVVGMLLMVDLSLTT